MIVDFDDDALEEYHLAARYSEEHFGLGERFVQIMEATLKKICASPQRPKSLGKNLRIVHLPNLPYNVIYHHERGSEVVKIFAVAHQHRKPGYWRSRFE